MPIYKGSKRVFSRLVKRGKLASTTNLPYTYMPKTHYFKCVSRYLDFHVNLLAISYILVFTICDFLRDLVSFIQFKKWEQDPWRSVTLSKVAGF